MKIHKIIRFSWRLTRNLTCILPWTQKQLFPPNILSQQFGRGDAEYAWHVFDKHRTQLDKCGDYSTKRILEVGPGRNIGTALLFWCREVSRLKDTNLHNSVTLVLWDVFENTSCSPDAWLKSAKELTNYMDNTGITVGKPLINVLLTVATGKMVPNIEYAVCPLQELCNRYQNNPFNLIYSHAALEHAWHIQATWDALFLLTTPTGWHSHRIDLADHGRRDTNYIEMLEWSGWAYWLTMRFIPGSINRWRAATHLDYFEKNGFLVLKKDREIRQYLPVKPSRLAKPYRNMDEAELKTTALDLVAKHQP